MAPNDKVVADEEVLSEEELKKENRFFELQKKSDKTPEEEKEVNDLKADRQTRFQKKINKYHWQTKTAQEEAEKEKERADRLEAELRETRAKVPSEKRVVAGEEYEEINGRKWATDEKLQAMIQNNEITETAAIKYQQERLTEKASEKAYQRMKAEEKDNTFQDRRKEDSERVLKEYPNFSKSHPDFDPNDPLYKKATELFAEAYHSLPNGLSRSIERAKEMLKTGNTNVDRSEDLEVETSRPSARVIGKDKDVVLTSEESEVAERMFCSSVNPKTNKLFTTSEAHNKMLEAKKRRSK